jgi:trigger factor
MKIAVKKLPKSEVEIEGELEADVFESYFSKALKKLGENAEIDGFRKGKVPEAVLLSKIPESHILEEMAEMALMEHYPKIIEEEKIEAISRPEIGITKLARNNPLGFKIKTAVLPEMILPNYKNIAKETISRITNKGKEITVTDEEVEKTILDIRKSRAPKIHMADVPVEAEAKEGHVHKEGEEHNPETEKEPEPELPEFNDEFVKALGPFENIEDFKSKLKDNIKLEKENQLKEKTRLKIVESIIAETKVDLPEILIEVELDKILYRMESDITAMGLKFEDYLKHLNKTTEDLKKEFRPDAEKKAKLALVLNKISEIEKISADREQVAKEVAMILEHYKDADPERAQMHAENVLTNEQVFQFLENQ